MVLQRDVPQDRGWAWICLLGCFFVNVFEMGGVKSFGVLFVELREHFDTTSVAAAWIMAINLFFGAALGPLATSLGMRFTNRIMVIVGGALFALGYVTSAFAPSIKMLYLTYGIISGVGLGLSFSPTIVMVSHYFEKRRALANGLSVSGSGIGTFVMPPLIRVLIDNYGLKGALIVFGGIMSNVCTCGMLMRPPEFYGQHSKKRNLKEQNVSNATGDRLSNCDNEEKVELETNPIGLLKKESDDVNDHVVGECDLLQNANRRDDVHESVLSVPQIKNAEDYAIKDDATTSRRIYRKLCYIPPDNNGVRRPMFDWEILRNPLFIVFFIPATFSCMGYPSVFLIYPAHAEQNGISKIEAALLVSLIGVADLTGRIVFGWFADLRLIKRKYCYTGAIFVTGVICFFFPFFPTFGSQAALCVFFGLFGGSFVALTTVVLVDALGLHKLANAYGVIVFGQGCAMLMSYPLVGFLQSQTGTWNASFYYCGVWMIIGSFTVFLEPMASKYVQQKTQATES